MGEEEGLGNGDRLGLGIDEWKGEGLAGGSIAARHITAVII